MPATMRTAAVQFSYTLTSAVPSIPPPAPQAPGAQITATVGGPAPPATAFRLRHRRIGLQSPARDQACSAIASPVTMARATGEGSDPVQHEPVTDMHGGLGDHPRRAAPVRPVVAALDLMAGIGPVLRREPDRHRAA